MIDFTVAIPTYNGASRLPLVLEKLTQQTQIEFLNWEVIVIDNNSTDETGNLIKNYQKQWSFPFALHYYFESQQGLAFARAKAIQKAQGKYVGFLDDDNIPALDWVYQAFQFGENYPRAGAYGGQIHAKFEVPPPENFDKIIGFLAIRERGNTSNLYQPEVLSLPTGAGLVVRSKVWKTCLPEKPLLSGRTENSLVCGSDWEPLLYMYKAGWEIWYNAAMHIDHLIPAQRLEDDYLLSLIHSSCLTFFPLRMLVTPVWKKPLVLVRTILGNLYKAILYRLQYGNKVQEDIIAKCELQIYLSRISSFFYFLKLKIQGV
ncbi:hormogonium polysaccharide biosynthesis glycosyltransferase HpsE [Spirulina sp. CS-785/01]|uniref:hormogonium polysaccharide biosynthesis glycosyltransferase HpsE n=1 Tax=Spirulina sp. CS-785/01 TaxID=3021716 RepID=UPI00232EDD9C|nr:hormogonium polysaccharide biosynthesis glycosyltransferase HpsE [Spirulina sp. CS-785/01]MDB9314591.1 hormogonium polysaccharide biosynthesis glycosyltransferase HpsE [Spirulina sp. CS-785/01]